MEYIFRNGVDIIWGRAGLERYDEGRAGLERYDEGRDYHYSHIGALAVIFIIIMSTLTIKHLTS